MRETTKRLFLCLLIGGVATALAVDLGAASGLPAARHAGRMRPMVTVIRTPHGGIQPQAAVDDRGVLHLIYFGGDPGAGDIFYVRREPGAKDFSDPIRVNSQPGSAIATGTIRGAHLAVGKEGRVHVSWMGSKTAEPKGPSGATPMLYTRLDDARAAFEAQRNVMQFAAGLDGGGSVAADGVGNVYVAWHAHGEGEGEANRRVWVARSADEGRTFARETPAFGEPTGACGCCGMRAFADRGGNLYVLYRAATEHVNRDMYLLSSKDHSRSFQGARLHPWKLSTCPMSTAAIAQGGDRVLTAWETEGQIFFTASDASSRAMSAPVPAPGETKNRKHPAIAGNADGQTLLVWTEGMGWKKGGNLAWQVFDRSGGAAAEKGEAQGVPVWSLPAAAALPEGFTIIY